MREKNMENGGMPRWLAVKILQEKLGHGFRRPRLLDMALTHSSWANESGRDYAHNERLEFLGDAVLELCVSSELYRRFPKAREGDLTRLRSWLVAEPALAALARELGLDCLLKLGVGEEKQGGRNRDAILCDVFEAVLAAVYEDGGFESAQRAVNRIFGPHWPEALRPQQRMDSKSRLQQLCQNLFGCCPAYDLEATHGPEHAKIFEVRLRLPDGREFMASNSSRKKAEQDAATLALATLEESGF